MHTVLEQPQTLQIIAKLAKNSMEGNMSHLIGFAAVIFIIIMEI
jgi:hypothetical protein